MQRKIEIIFVDDHLRFRKSIIEELISLDINVIGEASNGEECIQLLKTKSPDVLVLDLEMPVMDGNETFNFVKEKYPQLKILILSLHDEWGMVENYMRRGVKGYLPKSFVAEGVSILADGIKQIHEGKTYFYSYDKSNPLRYTKRETEIIPLLVECKTSKEIGQEIGIPERQVNKIRTQLQKKTNTRNATQFIKYCIEKGLKYLGKK